MILPETLLTLGAPPMDIRSGEAETSEIMPASGVHDAAAPGGPRADPDLELAPSGLARLEV